MNLLELNLASSHLEEYEEKGRTYYRLKDDLWTDLIIDNQSETNISQNFFNEKFIDMLTSRNYTINQVKFEDEIFGMLSIITLFH